MQIKYKGGNKFEVKCKDLDVTFADQLTVNGFVFPGPGEYEKSGAIINGIADGSNTIYIVNAEDMNLCYLGELTHELTEDEVKQIGDVDILFLPLGEKGTVNVKSALKVLTKIDPRVSIPMLYTDLGEFKKGEGLVDGNEIDILKIKKSELPEEERKTYLLTATE
ncbi:MAG: MBL fold metallo-hydrolase [Candidatus Berkelbacteria bacterium]